MSFKLRAISAGLIAVLLLGALGYGIKLKKDIENGEENPLQAESVYFWYTDDTLTEFFTNAAVQFHEANPDIIVVPRLVESNEYLETINAQSVKGVDFPDVYILSNDSLEKAFLAGLSSVTHDSEKVLNLNHFGQSALDAVSYRDQYVGYPLFFETSILVFNKTYLQDWLTKKQEDQVNGTDTDDEMPEGYNPAEEEVDYLSLTIDDLVPTTFDDILSFAKEYDAPDGVEGVLKWDVSDIFYNYFFAGNYMIVGGAAGDDSENIDIYNEKTIECMKVYQDLNQFFSIDAASSNYTTMIDDFIDGKFVFTIATSDVIERLRLAEEELQAQRKQEENLILAKEIMQKEGEIAGSDEEIEAPDEEDLTHVYEFGYAVIPDLKTSLGAQSLSVTDTLVINGYSVHKDAANRFAAFLSTNCADKIYEKTGKVAASTDAGYKDSALVAFQEEYAKSIPLPKIVEASNFWVQLEITFTKIWTGEDVDTLLRELSEQIMTQVTGKPYKEEKISD